MYLPAEAQRSDFQQIDFKKADAIARRYQGEALVHLPVLALRLTAQLKTDVERFRVLYYWVTHNIRGTYYLTMENARLYENWGHDPKALNEQLREFKKTVFDQLLNKKETLCTGYAFLLQELSGYVGLECKIVHGYGLINDLKALESQIPNHSWNAVKLDGKWYLCDATWASGTIDEVTHRFEFRYDDSFFLMTPSEFAKTHRPLDANWDLLQELPD